MPVETNLSDPDYVRHQYQTSANLNARIRLHHQCSTNKYGWQHWLFDQIHLPLACRVLELGCGTGSLWLENLNRIPSPCELFLSDLSTGMVRASENNLADHLPNVTFLTIDIQNIPFDDRTFDMVIANHMLYHVPDKPRALAEVWRVLKPGGDLYASTIGENHLLELNHLLFRFGRGLEYEFRSNNNAFSLENGFSQLRPYFTEVTLARYTDSLIVTDAALLTDYILSGRNSPDAELKNTLF